jgi:hypothetical protein
MTDSRIYLSPPDVSDVERKLLLEAFDSSPGCCTPCTTNPSRPDRSATS